MSTLPLYLSPTVLKAAAWALVDSILFTFWVWSGMESIRSNEPIVLVVATLFVGLQLFMLRRRVYMLYELIAYTKYTIDDMRKRGWNG